MVTIIKMKHIFYKNYLILIYIMNKKFFNIKITFLDDW
jgi:hypothetical protein